MRECDSVTSDVNTINTGQGRRRGNEDRGCVRGNVDSTTVRQESIDVTASRVSCVKTERECVDGA